MIRRPPRSTLFPTRRSSDLERELARDFQALGLAARQRGGGLAQPQVAEPHLLQVPQRAGEARPARSEEHTSELQSLAYLVCRLLLEKKKSIARRDQCRRGGH